MQETLTELKLDNKIGLFDDSEWDNYFIRQEMNTCLIAHKLLSHVHLTTNWYAIVLPKKQDGKDDIALGCKGSVDYKHKEFGDVTWNFQFTVNFTRNPPMQGFETLTSQLEPKGLTRNQGMTLLQAVKLHYQVAVEALAIPSFE